MEGGEMLVVYLIQESAGAWSAGQVFTERVMV